MSKTRGCAKAVLPEEWRGCAHREQAFRFPQAISRVADVTRIHHGVIPTEKEKNMEKFDPTDPKGLEDLAAIFKEIEDQAADGDLAGGLSSGYLCSITKECQKICWLW